MDDKTLTKKQQRLALHARIWVSGIIATGVFVLLMFVLEDEYALIEALLQFIVFLLVWVLLHYVFLRKHFKAIGK